MTKIKVRVIKQFPRLEGVLDLNDVVTLETINSEKDETVTTHIYVRPNEINGFKGGKLTDTQIIPAGNYEGYRFKSKNGMIYSDKEIQNLIGYVPMDVLFEKLNP